MTYRRRSVTMQDIATIPDRLFGMGLAAMAYRGARPIHRLEQRRKRDQSSSDRRQPAFFDSAMDRGPLPGVISSGIEPSAPVRRLAAFIPSSDSSGRDLRRCRKILRRLLQGRQLDLRGPAWPRQECSRSFAEDEIDFFHPCIPTGCPVCDGRVDLLDMPPKIIRQMELVEAPVVKEEHRSYPVWCEACRKIHYMPFPENVVKEGLFKARLTATAAYMKNVCHASFSPIGIQFYIASSYRLLQRYSRTIAYTRYIVARWQTVAIETTV